MDQESIERLKAMLDDASDATVLANLLQRFGREMTETEKNTMQRCINDLMSDAVAVMGQQVGPEVPSAGGEDEQGLGSQEPEVPEVPEPAETQPPQPPAGGKKGGKKGYS
jgi:hypothetical protein